MPNDFHGLPLHPLIVHATVVVVPLAALTVLLAALWPRFRAWSGPLPMGLSLVGLALVPLSTSTGETLERHVAHSALVERHTELAGGLLPWMLGLAIVASANYAAHRRGRGRRPVHGSIPMVLAVLAVVAAAGTTVQVVRIGESGAKAAWADTNMSA
ncbi:hypothetical protein ASC61_14420 [Aeromicrobium sp. Root344]|uniref:DUF2231 domain-containing protein n=1 Tax=Aeromicrobium sp. Root344 TaxID=1736521 RepID=UPI0006FD24B0|nr:DUF2231 domain-containing protein [Aeromicrobium sp. Root344]KQV76101.1 hypothetical protein ASC61_14420 [Aeromicrobium sp. Root344]